MASSENRHYSSCVLPSCPSTKHSAEQKQRHIVEVGLSLLAHASMPLKFWDEAFLTATFIINLLLSKVFNNETPVQRHLKVKPNYNSLRIFGHAYWPNLHPYNKRKLAYRSTRCLFLGYSPLHKGVKCLDVTTGRVYISRDVVFDENIFPFASLHPNAGRRLTQDILLLPTPHNACTHGDTQSDDHMPLPIIPVVTNPTQDTPPHAADAEDNGLEDEHTGENSSENDEETSENNSIFDVAEEDNMGTRSEANLPATSDSDNADPEEDPLASRPPIGSAAEEQQPRASTPLHVYTHRQRHGQRPPSMLPRNTPCRASSCCGPRPGPHRHLVVRAVRRLPLVAAGPRQENLRHGLLHLLVAAPVPRRIFASMLDPPRPLLLQLFLHLVFKPGFKKV
jgi:hypothetical protein